jgi:hypothetical protein
MQVSDEFFRFCSGLHQDFLMYGPTPHDWINGALKFVQKERLPTLRNYLDELLAGSYSDAELQEIYRSTHTELRIWDDQEARPFLAMIRDVIDRKCGS